MLFRIGSSAWSLLLLCRTMPCTQVSIAWASYIHACYLPSVWVRFDLSYEGNKVVLDYRRRYGVSWDVDFVELEILQVPIDPEYKERVLQTAAAQAAVKRRKRSRLRAQRADVWSQYEDKMTRQRWSKRENALTVICSGR
jgi:hypothetical protein